MSSPARTTTMVVVAQSRKTTIALNSDDYKIDHDGGGKDDYSGGDSITNCGGYIYI